MTNSRPAGRDRLAGWTVPREGPVVRHLNGDPGLPSQLPSTVAWILTNYEDGSYEGSGEALVGYTDGRAVFIDLGHCSCYGPWDNESLSSEGLYTSPELAKLMTGTAYQGRAGLLDAWGRSPFSRMTEAGLAQLLASPNPTLREYARLRGIPTISERRTAAGRTMAQALAREEAARVETERARRRELRATHRARRVAAALAAAAPASPAAAMSPIAGRVTARPRRP